MGKYDEKYLKTKNGRAHSLLGAYRVSDTKYGRGECTLTAEWIVDNIFTKPCVHCGETDWRKIGCNRLDNSRPHTPDNVEPCCKNCNDKLGRAELDKKQSKPLDQIDTETGEVIRSWKSAKETEECGFNQGSVCACCRGWRISHGKQHRVKQHKGYIWKYIQL